MSGDGRGGLKFVSVGVCRQCLNDSIGALHQSLTGRFSECPFCNREGLDIFMGDVSRGSVKTIGVKISCDACNKVYHQGEYLINGETSHHMPVKTLLEWQYFENGRAAESSRNYEDAARYYDRAGLAERAAKARNLDRTRYVKQVTVDVNKLISLLQSNNYAIPYKCPSCGASVRLDGHRDAVQFARCEYCNGDLYLADIEKMITSMMA